MVSSSFCWLVFARTTEKTCVGKLPCFPYLVLTHITKGGGKYSYYVLVIFFYVATFFPWYPHLIIRYSNM